MKENLRIKFDFLGKELLDEILSVSEIVNFESGSVLVQEGQFVKVIPIVLKGLVKVFTRHVDKELLLYYIKPDESCIMSFSSAIHNSKSKIFAVTESNSDILLVPSTKITQWVKNYPAINILFYNQYDLRYAEMIDTIKHLIYDKLDKRVLDYLIEKKQLLQINPIKISHKEIANDLGTAREVVSRIVKKLENDKVLIQHHDSIEIL
jgi:CRP/FNR family transcriptional regulator